LSRPCNVVSCFCHGLRHEQVIAGRRTRSPTGFPACRCAGWVVVLRLEGRTTVGSVKLLVSILCLALSGAASPGTPRPASDASPVTGSPRPKSGRGTTWGSRSRCW
jgi:hypothetical protein